MQLRETAWALAEKEHGLVELGKHTSLSAAMLSNLERGKLFPTLPTLLRVAMVFSWGWITFSGDACMKDTAAGKIHKLETQWYYLC